jgi:hypothetical protein
MATEDRLKTRERDSKILSSLLKSKKLTKHEREAFSNMVDRLKVADDRTMTVRQRQWAEAIVEKQGLDITKGDPHVADGENRRMTPKERKAWSKALK